MKKIYRTNLEKIYINQLIIDELKKQNLSKATCNDLEKHAYAVLDTIKDESLRNMHIMEGI